MARKEGRKPKPLKESDYLLGVHDILRMGGFRFILSEGGWKLSPAYEMNPNPSGNELTLNISLNAFYLPNKGPST